eukprot:10289381-Alexandrium_andersonii.AAC.1
MAGAHEHHESRLDPLETASNCRAPDVRTTNLCCLGLPQTDSSKLKQLLAGSALPSAVPSASMNGGGDQTSHLILRSAINRRLLSEAIPNHTPVRLYPRVQRHKR